MSPRLKPLLLPQLVEERRLAEQLQQLQQLQAAHDTTPTALTNEHGTITTVCFAAGPGTTTPVYCAPADPSTVATSVYCATDSSSSEVATPVTPTFSPRGHARYGSSCSSLDLASLAESPASPAAAVPKPAKRSLPDVEEEPFERDGDDDLLPEELYCLCDDACIHRDEMANFAIDYDLGFMSDGDYAASDRMSVKKKRTHDLPFTGITSRLSSRFPNLARWRPSKRSSLTASPTCELTFEHAYPASHAASSRSSSLSAPASHAVLDRSPEHPLPLSSPDPSFWDSTESVGGAEPSPADAADKEAASVRLSIERDRALATTPLLPPLFVDSKPDRPRQSRPPPPPPLPLHSPALGLGLGLGLDASAALSARPSVSSFQLSPAPLCTPLTPDVPVQLPAILPQPDEWSDRLGHANFTISPQPYVPEVADVDTLRRLRDDWDAARVSYTKHVVRTGENYGQKSKIYDYTEQKWAGIDSEWKAAHDATVARVLAAIGHHQQLEKSKSNSGASSRSRSRGRGRGRADSGNAAASAAAAAGRPSADEVFAGMEWRRVDDDVPTAICRMLEDAKFPARGDEDIVGPMERDAVMVRANSEDRKRSRFWRSLVERVRK